MRYRAFIVLMIFSIPLWGQDSLVTDSLMVPDTVISQVIVKDTSAAVTPAKDTARTKRPDVLEAPDLSEIFSVYKIIWAILFIIAGYLVIRFIGGILNRFAERSTKYRIAIKSLIPIVKILGWTLLTIIIVAGIFQPPAATILAFSASIGVAVGFASQDVLKNIFAGIVVLIDKPFATGDKIEVGNYYGEVVEIGLRSTRIVTPDDSLVSIPNNEIMNGSVSNSNAGEPNCQVVAEIYLPIDADTVLVRELATEVAMVSKYVYLDKPISVLFFNEIKERKSYLKMRLKAYVSDIRDEFSFKSEMTEQTVKKLVEMGILKKEE